MKRPGTKQRRSVILLLTVLTFGIAYYAGNRYSAPDLPQVSGILLQPASQLADFELKDQHGEPFGKQQLYDNWSLILLDPTPSIDSPGFRRLIQVHNRLANDSDLQARSRFVYLPRQHDAIHTAASRLGDNFTTLQGESSDIDALFTVFGMAEVHDHFTLYLIDPEANMRVLFTDSQDAATIAEDFTTLVTHQP